MIVSLILLVAKFFDVIASLVSPPHAPPPPPPPLPPAQAPTAFYNVRSEQGAQPPNNRLVTNDVRASSGDNVSEEHGVEAKPSQEKKLKVAINKVILAYTTLHLHFTYYLFIGYESS